MPRRRNYYSYRRRSSRRRSSKKPAYATISPSVWQEGEATRVGISAAEFVRAKFLDLTGPQLQRLRFFYGQKYGGNALRYFDKTYPKWQSGKTRMSGATQRRVLECVPPILPVSEQFELLSLYAPDKIDAIAAWAPDHCWLDGVNEAFDRLCQQVVDDTVTLDWFAEGVFTNEEIANFVAVFKYGLVEQLFLIYESVHSDLCHLLNAIKSIDAAVEADYTVRLLETRITFRRADELPATAPLPSLPKPEAAGKFRELLHRVFVEHGAERIGDQLRGKALQQLMLHDVDSVTRAIEASMVSEITFTVEAEGAGGTATIRVDRRSRKVLRSRVSGRGLAAAIFTGGVVVCTIALFANEDTQGFACYTLPFGGILAVWSWSWFNEAREEASDYEKRRSDRASTN